MPSQKAFGRRAAPQREFWLQPSAATAFAPAAVVSSEPVKVSVPPQETPGDVDQELEEWKASRKIQKRSFREPWRTLAIASTIGFGASSWLLPDSVADVAQLVTAALCAASFFAGFRMPQPEQKLFSEIHD